MSTKVERTLWFTLQILFGFMMGIFLFTILYFIGDYFNGN